MEKKTYTKEFKEEAVKLVKEHNVSIMQAAAELGISQSALRKWVAALGSHGKAAFPGSGNLSPADQKIRELEKKLRLAEMERDILKKATAFFAKGSL